MVLLQYPNDKTSAEDQWLVHAEQVKQLYQYASAGMVGTLINSAILAYMLWNVIAHRNVVIWIVCLSAITFFRFLQLYKYRQSAVSSSADASRWEHRFIAGLFLLGVMWGATGLFLFPVESTVHQVLLFFVLGGMVAGAAGIYSMI